MATVTHLREALEEIASAINPDEDIVMVYLAGRSNADGSLRVSLPPLGLVQLTGPGLRPPVQAGRDPLARHRRRDLRRRSRSSTRSPTSTRWSSPRPGVAKQGLRVRATSWRCSATRCSAMRSPVPRRCRPRSSARNEAARAAGLRAYCTSAARSRAQLARLRGSSGGRANAASRARAGGARRAWPLPSTSKRSSIPTATLPVVRGMSFSLAPGAIGCLLGPSGCGKTTVLRCLAGFEPIDGGVDRARRPRRVARRASRCPPEERGVGMVFQDFALFPHLNVARNVAFGLRRQSDGASGQARGRDARARRACGMRRAPGRTSFPAASSSAWRWRARSRRSRS